MYTPLMSELKQKTIKLNQEYSELKHIS